jgi:hypothetical protein
MESQIDVKVIKRSKELTPGIFKKGTEITIDLEEMECYHSGLVWKVVRVDEKTFSLTDGKTLMEVI